MLLLQAIEMPYHFALPINNGVKPSELSEIITYLAFYSGWANAMSAVAVAKDIFHQRGIGYPHALTLTSRSSFSDRSSVDFSKHIRSLRWT